MNTQAHMCVHTRRHTHTLIENGQCVWALGTEGVSEGAQLPSQD